MVFVQVRPHGLWRSLVSALDWGSRGREFKSPQPDSKVAGQKGFRRGEAPSSRVECPRIAHGMITANPYHGGMKGGIRAPRTARGTWAYRIDLGAVPGGV